MEDFFFPLMPAIGFSSIPTTSGECTNSIFERDNIGWEAIIGSTISSLPNNINSVFQGERSTACATPSKISEGPKSLPIASMASFIRASVLSMPKH